MIVIHTPAINMADKTTHEYQECDLDPTVEAIVYLTYCPI
jgi:hypothetical protein